jgi:hypothetical protein
MHGGFVRSLSHRASASPRSGPDAIPNAFEDPRRFPPPTILVLSCFVISALWFHGYTNVKGRARIVWLMTWHRLTVMVRIAIVLLRLARRPEQLGIPPRR